ncbi:hypothetical protein [Paraglaciecola sp.]|uniref:hypothetical protein n=1 Tax=Paraglaciecola sp. TaxID=1920173 RepID=UPI00273DC6C3|nr:hypothetical protein [Paraglaciecola sp.]MDP5030575.1 hypothetical protein [Paraglaciecola sp.]
MFKTSAISSLSISILMFSLCTFASDVTVKPLDQPAIFKQLNTALSYFDETSVLPDAKWFSRDKSSANKDLDETINEVIQLLDAPEIGRSRINYRILEQKTIQEYNEIARLQEQRLFAPSGEATFIADNVPFAKVKEWTAKTRGDFDALIALRKDNIATHKESMNAILLDMQKLFYSMGIEFDAEQIEVWLSSVVGDSVLSMSVVFNSIKQITQQLEVATVDSGENLSFAKRYYGMVVILHKLMLKMQTDFLTTIDNAYLPKLVNFKNEANAVIKESEKLLRSGGNRETLELNIQSNKMTIKVIDLYASLLKEQRSKIFEAMQITQREYEVSNNTYKTVNLSSQVSQLIKQGRNTFQTLINLQIPSAQPFQNEEMKEQFRLLSQRLNN